MLWLHLWSWSSAEREGGIGRQRLSVAIASHPAPAASGINRAQNPIARHHAKLFHQKIASWPARDFPAAMEIPGFVAGLNISLLNPGVGDTVPACLLIAENETRPWKVQKLRHGAGNELQTLESRAMMRWKVSLPPSQPYTTFGHFFPKWEGSEPSDVLRLMYPNSCEFTGDAACSPAQCK